MFWTPNGSSQLEALGYGFVDKSEDYIVLLNMLRSRA